MERRRVWQRARCSLRIKDAVCQGLLLPVRHGARCDDLLVITASGRRYLTEVKACFTGQGYLLRCLPKAAVQLQKSVEANPQLCGVLLVLISIKQKSIALLHADAEKLLHAPDRWIVMAKEFVMHCRDEYLGLRGGSPCLDYSHPCACQPSHHRYRI